MGSGATKYLASLWRVWTSSRRLVRQKKKLVCVHTAWVLIGYWFPIPRLLQTSCVIGQARIRQFGSVRIDSVRSYRGTAICSRVNIPLTLDRLQFPRPFFPKKTEPSCPHFFSGMHKYFNCTFMLLLNRRESAKKGLFGVTSGYSTRKRRGSHDNQTGALKRVLSHKRPQRWPHSILLG